MGQLAAAWVNLFHRAIMEFRQSAAHKIYYIALAGVQNQTKIFNKMGKKSRSSSKNFVSNA
jgi:peptidase E